MYIFVLIIVIAFAGMCWITYTEKGLTDFLEYSREKEVVVIDPVFQALRNDMELIKGKVPTIESNKVDTYTMNTKFLVKNKPLHVAGWAKKWKAIKKWKDLKYFSEKIPTANVEINTINGFGYGPRRQNELPDFSLFKSWPYSRSTVFHKAIELISNNTETRKFNPDAEKNQRLGR